MIVLEDAIIFGDTIHSFFIAVFIETLAFVFARLPVTHDEAVPVGTEPEATLHPGNNVFKLTPVKFVKSTTCGRLAGAKFTRVIL